jgi:hypothetical protein
MYVNNNPIRDLCRKAYPDYTGRKFQIEVRAYPINCASYWSGGSGDYFTFMRMDTLEIMSVPQQSAFDRKVEGVNEVSLIPGMVCIKRTYFCGKDLGCKVYIHPENAPRLLPENVELTDLEKTVLRCTRSYKSSYAGISNYRQKESGLTIEVWNHTKDSLIRKGLLNRAGALTIDGKNAVNL